MPTVVTDIQMEAFARENPMGREAPLLRLLDAARADGADWKRQFEMYARAWERELGPIGFHKRHRIDALVEATRRMREQWFALWEADRQRTVAAGLAVRDECEATWRTAAAMTAPSGYERPAE